MCGIAGELNWSGQADTNLIKNMIMRIRHRGPDDAGIWNSANNNCVLGHARLSIIDISPSGHQPMVDKSTGNNIVFNGEIYNYQEQRKQCESDGYQFHSNTDTEVILALYKKYDLNCLKYLRGMFAFAIWDAKKERLFLARDRVGKKPLNYYFNKKTIIFCSEINPLIKHPHIQKEIDQEALAQYFQLQYIPSPKTIYKHVYKLPPGHYAIYSKNDFEIKKYWNINYNNKISITEDDALELFEEKLTEAIRLRMISDVPIGALLSGGIDSSVVVAIMSKLSNDPINTFSIGFNEQEYNELDYAKFVADTFNSKHRPNIINGDINHILPRLVKHYGEPFSDSSAIPSFYVSEYSRKHVTVALNGDGGDELLAGYPRYCITDFSFLSGSILGNLHHAKYLSKCINNLVSANTPIARLNRKWLSRFSNPEIECFANRKNWGDEHLKMLLNSDAKVQILQEWREQWLQSSRQYANNPIERMLWIDNNTYLPGDLLVKMDIASMQCGLETRSPFLDHEIIEFCASLPVNLKVKNKVGKYLLKRLASKFFTKDFVYRRKMGFAIPIATWLNGPLKEMTHQLLYDRDLLEPLDKNTVDITLKEFYTDNIDHSSRIWTLLMYCLWKKECF